jgi:hypothetical protein
MLDIAMGWGLAIGACLALLGCGSSSVQTSGTGGAGVGGTTATGGVGVGGAGGAPAAGPIKLSYGEPWPLNLAVDDKTVFWTDHDTASVTSMRIGGSTTLSPTVLASDGIGSQAWGIAVDATNLYWTAYFAAGQNGTINAIPKAGGTRTRLVSDMSNPSGLAADATSLYWVNQGPGRTMLMKMPKAGGTPTMLALTDGSPTGELILDENSVYFTTTGLGLSTAAGILKVAKTGGDPVGLFPGPAAHVAGLATDGVDVYWADNDESNYKGSIMKVPAAGGTPTVLVTDQDRPVSIAVDAANVYWTNYATLPSSGTVMKMPKAGGPPVMIAGGLTAPRSVTVDATNVYWVSAWTSGPVYQAPK